MNEEWLKNYKVQPHAKSIKETKWFTAVLKAINQIQPDTTLIISKTRLYKDSINPTLNANCKLCNIKYVFKVNK